MHFELLQNFHVLCTWEVLFSFSHTPTLSEGVLRPSSLSCRLFTCHCMSVIQKGLKELAIHCTPSCANKTGTDPAEPGYDPGCVCLTVTCWPVTRNKSCSDFFCQVRLGPGQMCDHVPKLCAVAPSSEALAALSEDFKDWQHSDGCIPTRRAELRVQGTCFAAYQVYC